MWIGALSVSALLLGGCVATPDARTGAQVGGFASAGDGAWGSLYVLRAARPDRGWVVMLPGSSGLVVLGDDKHYFEVGRRLGELGFDVLLVDYKAFYRASDDRPDVATGEKIAWVVHRVVEGAKSRGLIDDDARGVLAAWSLGAEGVWALGNENGDSFDALGIDRCVLWYPSVERVMDESGVRELEVPVLAMVGDADDVTLLDDLESVLDLYIINGIVELVVYPQAHHGFDIESIGPSQSMRFPPIIGEQVTFGYNRNADLDAWARAVDFLAHPAQGDEITGRGSRR